MAFRLIVLGVLLTIAAYTDLQRRQIPNPLVCLGLIVSMLLCLSSFVQGKPNQMYSSIMAGGFAFVLHLIPYLCGTMGAGDVKLALVVGLLLGWQEWLAYLGVFCVVSLLLVLFLLCLGKRKPASLPLAPLMAVAFWLNCL